MLRGSSRGSGRPGRSAVGAVATALALGGLLGAPASAQEADGELVPAQSARRGPATPPAEETGEAPDVGLDDLLRLPTGYGAEMDRKGGATAPEWRARFEGARSQLADAKKKLEQINAELDQMSGDSSAWSVAAPGSSDPQASPLSLRLRNEMKEQRGVIEQAERDLRALHVEADLAGVPDAWRE